MIVNQRLTITQFYEKMKKMREAQSPKPKIEGTPLKTQESTPKSNFITKSCRSQFSMDRSNTLHQFANLQLTSKLPNLKRLANPKMTPVSKSQTNLNLLKEASPKVKNLKM
jgi:hypothetical protein